jgi:hypothetical protein
MTVIPFPRKATGPKKAIGERGPVPIFICLPSYEDMADARPTFGLGYSREEAQLTFYAGGRNQEIQTRIFSLQTAPKWVKWWVVSQYGLFEVSGQPLSPVDEEVRKRLGVDPYRYGKGPRLPRPRR